MKKMFSKIGKGFSKLKETKAKIIVTLILAVIMLIDVNPFILKAGRETLVYTFKDGIQHPYAYDNNHNSYSYYSISKMGGHIAYCIDYDIKNPPNGTGLQYIKNVKSSKVVAVLMNGYPTKTAAQLGLPNDEEAYLATQMAVWTAVNGTSDTKGLSFDMNKLQPNLKYSSYTDEMVTNGKRVANQLLNTSYNPGTFSFDSSSAKVNYDYSNTQIKIGPYKAAITGYSSLTKVNVALLNQPSGTLLVDKNGTQKSTFARNEEIYVLVNKSQPASSLKLTATGTANKYVGVVYGSGSYQNFVFLDTEQENVSGSATATWEESKGNIKIVKADQDAKPIQGAEFTLSDSTGKQITSGKTDANGILQFNKLDLGNYTVTETSVPDGYIIQQSTFTTTVKRNQTSTLNIQNTKVKGVLQVTKLEKTTSAPIPGVIFEIYDNQGASVGKVTTDANGIATSAELPKGKYTYKEIYAPDGYIMDDKVREFSITETINAVRETITNQKIVGELQIQKIGDDGSKKMKGAEFEIYDINKKLVSKLITDENGKAVAKNLAKGTYTYKETKAPEGYDLDPIEYNFKIETLNQVVEENVTNKKIYGTLQIEKVDESNLPILGVEFEILDENNKIVKTAVTDEKGIAKVDELPVGKYKYRESKVSDDYVLDEKEYDFEITSEIREAKVKVVNQRAKGVLKIVKIDKDSKVAIANAKFNVVDKINNDIVDSIVTDENGVARTKALPTGEYIYQEVEVSEDYILDSATYDVKIKKNNETVEKKVTNEHKKLPVTGGFVSTDGLIVIIVASASVIAYIIFKLVQNKKSNPTPPTTENVPVVPNNNLNNQQDSINASTSDEAKNEKIPEEENNNEENTNDQLENSDDLKEKEIIDENVKSKNNTAQTFEEPEDEMLDLSPKNSDSEK